MSSERRYQDHEIREILEMAIRGDEKRVASLASGTGLTISQLQEVGQGIGLSPDRIADAVLEFEGRGQALPRSSVLGLPTRVGRVVPLARAPTEREWEALVADLRMTFGVKGETSVQGGLREWSQDELHALLEPDGSGYRLRLTDTNEGALGGLALAVGALAFTLFLVIVLIAKDDAAWKFVVPAMFGAFGSAMMAGSALALRSWAEQRERQMADLASRASALIGPAEEGPEQS